MAGKIQDRGQMRGVLASLKGAWKRVAGRGSNHSAPDATPEPVELQTSVDEAPAAEPVPVATVTPDYAVPDATPAEAGVEADTVEPLAAEKAADAGVRVTEAADEPELEDALPEASAESVSEPLEVASPEAAKVVPAAKKAATSAKTAQRASADPSPFIPPVSAEPGPDSSWTVAQLRALAKERGVRGYSSMSKAQLLGALNGPQA